MMARWRAQFLIVTWRHILLSNVSVVILSKLRTLSDPTDYIYSVFGPSSYGLSLSTFKTTTRQRKTSHDLTNLPRLAMARFEEIAEADIKVLRNG